ncbi:ABC transporter ATP-binding protein [Desulfosudis oleivorans]|uniref:ABC transporter-related protein n=1 Tax=Desulfosudis oleivorans (strain DSM 6200 / JCM 39069 / Hxd3) TaxID=96561 RepID=A8ZWV4_DESOH|nr:ABC transporter ATP-binding protein [Desulfosudis oleivorans]ABW68435.1 ABC transporter-related protein [Desulfosudis oleivorans Hxd3]
MEKRDMKGRVAVCDLSIRLPGFRLEHISFSIEPGEFFLLLGPTGAGKTLTLEALAGLVPINTGTLHVNGQNVTRLPPEARSVGIVYQDYALFPHLSVMENICYGVRYRKPEVRMPRKQINELMSQVGIAHLANRSIVTLSGGEKQRVALLRALAVNPSVLLLDEPLSALDPGFREDLQQLLKALCRATGTTFLMVTHDVDEARFLGERAAVLHDGRIEQTGPVAWLFQKPSTVFVARFTGVRNIFPAVFDGDRAILGGCELMMEAPAPASAAHVAVRSENVRLTNGTTGSGGVNQMTGRVTGLTHMGPYVEAMIQAGGLPWRSAVSLEAFARINPAPGRTVGMEILPEAVVPISSGT